MTDAPGCQRLATSNQPAGCLSRSSAHQFIHSPACPFLLYYSPHPPPPVNLCSAPRQVHGSHAGAAPGRCLGPMRVQHQAGAWVGPMRVQYQAGAWVGPMRVQHQWCRAPHIIPHALLAPSSLSNGQEPHLTSHPATRCVALPNHDRVLAIFLVSSSPPSPLLSVSPHSLNIQMDHMPISRQMSGSSLGNTRLNDSSPPRAAHT